jgi:VanZ family protein
MRARTADFLRSVLPAIAYAALLFWISSLSPPDAPTYGLEWGDKINHAGAFGLMAILWFRASAWFLPRSSRRTRCLLTLALVALYGATDEIHQSFVPGRESDITDWIADVVGATLAIAVIALIPVSSGVYRLLFGAGQSGRSS